MKRTIAFIVLTALLLLSGCQPTPEVEYVVNKGDNVAEERINSTPLPTAAPKPTGSGETPDPSGTDETPAPTETDASSPWSDWSGQAVFPDRWEDHIKTQYKEMIISAYIVTPEMTSFPVELVRKSGYTEEDLYRAANYLFHDVTAWRRGTRPSREQIMDAIQYVASSDMSEADKNDQLEILRIDLESSTVTDADNIPCSSVEEIPAGGSGVSVFTADGAGSMSLIGGSIHADTNFFGVVQAKSGFGNDPDRPDFSPEISLEEAKAKAEEFFSAMGLEGFDLYFSDEARCVNGLSTEVIDMGWQLRYIRSYGYVPFSVSQYDASTEGSFDFDNKWGRDVTEFSEPIAEEKIVLYVSSRGVESVSMSVPYEHIATVNENVQLCDFDALTERIRLLFTAAISSPYQVEGYYVIEEMILTVVPQPKKDSSDYYMMPVWVLKIGEYVSIGDGLGVSHFYIPGDQAFDGWYTVAFNAIDGTRVTMPKL